MMPEQPSVHKTKDGSTTLFSTQFKQHYHNPNGAVAESRQVYFETPGVPGTLSTQTNLTILEVGFGSGLNLILLLDYLEKTRSDIQVTFVSVEAFPIDPDTALKFDFGDDLEKYHPRQKLSEIFLNSSPGWNSIHITPQVTLKLFIGFFEDCSEIDILPVDFIFHDPFSPDVNADLWTPDVFKKLAELCKPGAVLSTYCAASSARAAMAVGGWNVARAPGALGKREMTLASLDAKNLTSFKRVNEKRLIERYKTGNFK